MRELDETFKSIGCILCTLHKYSFLQLSISRSYGIQIVWPISKRLMCGDVGAGAMEEPEKIARHVRIALENPKGEVMKFWWDSNRYVILGTSIAIVCAMAMFKSRFDLYIGLQ